MCADLANVSFSRRVDRDGGTTGENSNVAAAPTRAKREHAPLRSSLRRSQERKAHDQKEQEYGEEDRRVVPIPTFHGVVLR